jgi:hypothetical protein
MLPLLILGNDKQSKTALYRALVCKMPKNIELMIDLLSSF